MRADKKAERNRNRLAELFGLQEHLPTEPTPPPGELQLTASREAEAVIEYIKRPQTFKQVECGQCGGTFATDRGNVKYCSDRCRAKWLENIGIIWNPSKPQEERWDYREPLIVPPPALVVADLAVEVAIQQEQETPTLPETAPVVLLESATSPAPIVFDL